MSLQAIVLLAGFVVGVLLLAVPMGRWLAAIAEVHSPGFARLDHGLLRACGADPQREHGWREYALAVLVFNVLGAITVYALQRLQGALPLSTRRVSPASRRVRPSTPRSASSPTPTGRATPVKAR